jgi:hypothetical protein
MATIRCSSTFTRRSGEVLQCENISGHGSVHYNGNVWWPNRHGLPDHQKAAGFWQSIIRWLYDHV